MLPQAWLAACSAGALAGGGLACLSCDSTPRLHHASLVEEHERAGPLDLRSSSLLFLLKSAVREGKLAWPLCSPLATSAESARPEACRNCVYQHLRAAARSNMSFLPRLRPAALRNLRPRAGDSHNNSFWSEGKHEPSGYLFNETPPPPGQRRKWESWEAPWCALLTPAVGWQRAGGVRVVCSQLNFPSSRVLREWATFGGSRVRCCFLDGSIPL